MRTPGLRSPSGQGRLCDRPGFRWTIVGPSRPESAGAYRVAPPAAIWIDAVAPLDGAGLDHALLVADEVVRQRLDGLALPEQREACNGQALEVALAVLSERAEHAQELGIVERRPRVIGLGGPKQVAIGRHGFGGFSLTFRGSHAPLAVPRVDAIVIRRPSVLTLEADTLIL